MKLLRRIVAHLSPREARHDLARALDRLRGLDFLDSVEPEALGLDPKLSARSSPSGDRWLRLLLRSLPIASNDRIIDIGCGKGSAMRLMLEFPFEHVAGIEITQSMATIARRNFERLRVAQGRVQVHVADARTFDRLGEFNYVYLYNPFPSVVLVPFLHQLGGSLVERPRPLTLIYNHPLCHADVMATGRFEKIREAPADWGHKIFVYRSAGA
jgi:SAM-dependent methyltransferase